MPSLRMLSGLALGAAILLGAGTIATGSAQQEGKVIKITVKKFEYDPAVVTLKKGEPVVLELTTLDRLHGFSSPDLNLHADVVPNKPVRVALTPDKPDKYTFLCDIFCGTGHGNVHGEIDVTE